MSSRSEDFMHQRYSVNVFADACRQCGEEWPCRQALLAENERLREALTLIAERDSLLEANGQAFGLHAARRMQAQAAAALSGSTAEADR